MMLSNTKLLTNGPGNIKNIVGMGERGMLINNNTAMVGEMLLRDVNDRSFAREWSNKTIVAREWAIKQTWDNRVIEWVELINNIG